MRRAALRILIALVVAVAATTAQTPWLGQPDRIAPGIEYFKSTDRTLVDNQGPIAVYLLKLDPSRISLTSALSNEEVMDAERVDAIAARHQAIAAINAGFFNTTNGEPVNVLKIAGQLVSDATVTRGVVAIKGGPRGKPELAFDQAAVRMTMTFKVDGRDVTVPIDGVDTTRARGKLMAFTTLYHKDTDTAANGIEWAVGGKPLRVLEVRRDLGHTPIPKDGLVLSYGGLDPPAPLSSLTVGTKLEFQTIWKTVNGLSAKDLERADDITNGAGLLKLGGKTMTNWRETENLSPAQFIDMRHPRTMIGVDAKGAIWLIAIDGRQPDYSIGMTLPDLVRLCDRLDIRDALNLDGGGSTTMVIKGAIVNKPSDATGPRPVSDALVVKSR